MKQPIIHNPDFINLNPGLLPAIGLLTFVYLVYVVWVGGDYFPASRFLVPLLAPIALLVQGSARAVVSALPAAPFVRLGVPAILSALLVVQVGYLLSLENPRGLLIETTGIHTGYIDRWGAPGLWLRENTPPGTVTVAKGAGAIAYYSRRRTVDMLGLNDLHIAHLDLETIGQGKAGHEKRDPSYVLDRRPDYILAEWDPDLRPVADRLKRDYEYLLVRSPTGMMVEWWKRK